MLSHEQFKSLRRVLEFRRREARIVRVVALLVLALVIAGTGAYVISAADPPWWSRVAGAQDDPDSRRLATMLENMVVTELSRIRPPSPSSPALSEPWAMRIRSRELNAWLAAKLPAWIDGRGPAAASRHAPAERVRDFHLVIREDSITFGARVGNGSGRVAWITCSPVLRDHALWLDAPRAGLGRLPVPLRLLLPTESGGALVSLAEDARAGAEPADASPTSPPSGLRLALLDAAPALRDPSIRLADGRRVHLIGLQLEPDALVVTCVTSR
ncbi:MAG: hypothetical protein AB7K52_04095 [Phycisphaerales bacterium]